MNNQEWKEKTPPSEKQLKYCYDILERIKECQADEDGQPLFEKSMAEADKFIKENRGTTGSLKGRDDTDISAGDWGGIPNY
jgi:hypothetical protein